MAIVGVIPAAGYATRLQPLEGSKEVLAIRGKPIMDHLVERMRAGGCDRIRVVTRPEKHDVIAHVRTLNAEVKLGHPDSVSSSFLIGMDGLADDEIALIGFPDTIWKPIDGFRPLVAMVEAGCDVAIGLFQIDPADLPRSDVVVFGRDGSIAGVEIKPARPRSEWIWGCAAARVSMWAAGLAETEWPGEYIDVLCRQGRDVRGFKLSDVWLDVGTKEALARVMADGVDGHHGAP
jgi:glucose-1-phosphate thymidylyltransferase